MNYPWHMTKFLCQKIAFIQMQTLYLTIMVYQMFQHGFRFDFSRIKVTHALAAEIQPYAFP